MGDWKDKIDKGLTVAGVITNVVNPSGITPQDQFGTYQQNQIQSSVSQTDIGRQNPTNMGR